MDIENNFAILCVNDDNYNNSITKGEVYKFVNGRTIWKSGVTSLEYSSFEDFITRNEGLKDKVIKLEDVEEEYPLTIQDIFLSDDYKEGDKFESDRGFKEWTYEEGDLYDGVDCITEHCCLKLLLDMKFKKVEPKKEYINHMTALRLLDRGKEVSCEHKGEEIIYKGANVVKIEHILNGNWYIKK